MGPAGDVISQYRRRLLVRPSAKCPEPMATGDERSDLRQSRSRSWAR